MTSSTGSISVSGLLGGTAGQIDTTALISQLMTAAALPQTNLKNQLAVQQAMATAYQSINTKLAAVQTAAEALTDPTAWTATSASSSSPSVIATSTGTATTGSTSFDVLSLAAAQISTVAADGSGNVVNDPSAGITVTGADGTAHQIALTSGSAADVAAAVNAANVGVRAGVVQTDNGTVLQLTSSSTGSNGAFTTSGFSNSAQTVVAAANAQIGVGAAGSGGYTVSSQTNTFTGVIPGVTFTVSGLASNVNISVSSDEQSMSDKVQALVTAANAATTEITNDSGQGAILQGSLDVETLQASILSAVSQGTAAGGTLSTYGIDIDKNGVMSFDADTFAGAYAADPTGTQTAIAGSFAASLDTTAKAGTDPISGSVTLALNSITSQESTLNDGINDWTSRLTDIQNTLTTKYAAMETALAKLQSQQTYLNSMMASINGSSSSSSSSSSS